MSKSEKGLTANVCCLSSLYPFVVATASSASRDDWNSKKQYLQKEQKYTLHAIHGCKPEHVILSVVSYSTY